MVTEESYKHALEIVKAYREQQKNNRLEIEEQERNLQIEKWKELNVTLDTSMSDIYGHINHNLFYALRQIRPQFFELSLSFFRGVTKEQLYKFDRIGKKTVDEFVNLMAAAGHKVL